MTEPIDRRTFLAVGGAVVGGAVVGLGADPRRLLRHPLAKREPKRLSEAIRGQVIRRGAPGFPDAAHVYNERFDAVLPQAVARPVDSADVQAAIRWGLGKGVAMRARSGGHSYAGYSTLADGIVLDLRKMNWIEVDRAAGTATVGAGAQLIDVYTALASHGATIPGGSCPSVGVSGVTLGGGMGLSGRAFGLTTDHLVGARIVTAEGALRTVAAKSDPDLIWALRGGGGGNFGVVTEFIFRLQPLPASAAYFFVSWPWESAGEALDAWLRWAPRAADAFTSIFHLNGGAGSTSAEVTGQYLGPADHLSSLLGALRAVPGANVSTGQERYLQLQMLWAGCSSISEVACHTVGAGAGGSLERASFDAKSDYLTKTLPREGLSVLTSAVEARAGIAGSGAILFDSYGGAINQIAPDATAFVHRDVLCAMQYLSYDGDDGWLAETWSKMRPYVSGQAYQNYIDASLPHWRRAYYGANYPRLLATRERLDPHRYFKFPQAI
jgi:FAD binding domain/Berberine and berberine like